VIVRYNGGANAGHTVVVGRERYALHLIPSGILYPDKTCVIANGTVVDPEKLLEEIDSLRRRGVEVGDNLRVSSRAHLVLPYHKEQDAAYEEFLAARSGLGEATAAIGTTRRGIGPAYADKVRRSTAVRVGDLLHPDRLRRRLELSCGLRAAEMTALGVHSEPPDPAAMAEWCLALGRRLAPFIEDTAYRLHDCVAAGRSILFEGANACLLDIDHGTYPFVTSSNCSSLGIPAGTGLPGRLVHRVVGIMKAYSTRVGAGPFPTELSDAIGERIRTRGREFGTTTGRPRRCGWLDLVAVRYAAMICGADALACTLLDVLSGLDELRICVAYRRPDGGIVDRFLPDAEDLEGLAPIYETLPGWQEEIEEAPDREGLPGNARRYLDRIEELVGCPIELIGVGPERNQTLTSPAIAADLH
jgi:adenylosuccinate synthase